MPGRVDVPPALVVTLEVQAAGRDDADSDCNGAKDTGPGWSASAPGLWRRCRLPSYFEGEPYLGWPQPDRGTRAVLGQVQDVGVTALGGDTGLPCASAVGTAAPAAAAGKGLADEIAAPAALGHHCAYALRVQEMLRAPYVPFGRSA